ncbi:ATP-binding protein [Proteus mirabilis]|uniref:ATP-binding protein n=1 Tax=Proteus mirabilis TaxID=584 RepID=UPI0034D3A250
MSKANVSYTGKDIKELPYPLNVQTRPEMYIGTPNSTGMLTCGREILNNCVDEFLAGFATSILIERLGEWKFRIKDNGRGVPFDKHESGKNTMEVIFGALHAGRNFTKKTVYSTGLFGVGSSCVNALSKKFEVISRRGNKSGHVIFEKGIIKKVELNKASPEKGVFKNSSTTVEFELDPSFFEKDSVINDEDFIALVRNTAYLTFGLEITYVDQKKKKHHFSYGEDGMAKLLEENLHGDELFSPLILPKDVISDTSVQVSFTYRKSFSTEETIYSYCNTIGTSDHGMHVTGFKRSISQKITAYLRDNKLCKEKIDNKDIYAGLTAAISVMVFEPKYSSQTKQKLDNSEVNGHVVSYMNAMLDDWLLTNPKEMKLIAAKIDSAAKARIAQKRALENAKKDSESTILNSLSSPNKFTDCNSKNPEERELFLVEGKLPCCSR